MTITFDEWMRRVNTHIAAKCAGMTADDLPDWSYYSDYEEGRTPKATARRAIKYAKSC